MTDSNASAMHRIASLIKDERLWQNHMTMAEIGAIENFGVNRQALSQEDIAARQKLVGWALERGYEVETDKIANLYFKRKGRNDHLPPVATGSHIDTQPQGGRFDGIYGVLAGLEVFEALDEAKIETDHPLVVIAWTNEEGSRFSPGAMGSSVFSGVRRLDHFKNATDDKGVLFADALAGAIAALPEAVMRTSPLPLKAYLETHIEQGPVLEKEALDIGVVTGIQGARWFDVEVTGKSAHAGTTPMSHRRDALKESNRIITLLLDAMVDLEDRLRFTIGRLEVSPNSPNTIADKVTFAIDLRHPDADELTAKGDAIEGLCKVALEDCNARVIETFHRPPCRFPEALVSVVERSAKSLKLSSRRMISGAFHDAIFLAEVCPSAMIFVPSVGGISHNPSEYSHPHHLAAGARVLGCALLTLAEEGRALPVAATS